MNQARQFTVRRAFLLPLGLLLLLALILLIVSALQEQPKGKIIILAFIILPVAILFIESVFRRTVIGSDQVTVHKLLRRKTLRFSDLTAVDLVTVRKRAFLSLSTEQDFLVLSNAYACFPEIVKIILARTPDAAVKEETRQAAQMVPVKSSDIFSCWLAVALVAFILYLQLGGRF